MPSVQTSEDNPVVPAPGQTTGEDSEDDTTDSPTTTTNPYGTTTPTNAGHI